MVAPRIFMESNHELEIQILGDFSVPLLDVHWPGGAIFWPGTGVARFLWPRGPLDSRHSHGLFGSFSIGAGI